MIVPAYIKKAIKDNAKANIIVNRTDKVVRDWLVKNNLSNDHAFDLFIDCCNTGYSPDFFISELENDQISVGNDED